MIGWPITVPATFVGSTLAKLDSPATQLRMAAITAAALAQIQRRFGDEAKGTDWATDPGDDSESEARREDEADSPPPAAESSFGDGPSLVRSSSGPGSVIAAVSSRSLAARSPGSFWRMDPNGRLV